MANGILDTIAFHQLHRLGYLSAQHATGSLLNDNGVPVVLTFQPCVIVLTTIDAVERDGRR